MCTLNKICCCCNLPIGAVIIAILDWILTGFQCILAWSLLHAQLIYTYIIGFLIFPHFISCPLVIISYFYRKKILPMIYLITGILRIISLIGYIIMLFIILDYRLEIISTTFQLIQIALGIYYWICIYSWYKALDSSEET
ncbi:uncharacterized protein LOC115623099 [Scaptodrosophila lebanonensis]|uniref:Uncharacterized protein LOC115623099 n=1 Tax=Drosophila lebanonensis TaxID=7225 RepID=A0A6J2TCQ2_DROLE|nr:uncharacterized protein LOC115623099 [Scaptodrosophila lebanonensis]